MSRVKYAFKGLVLLLQITQYKFRILVEMTVKNSQIYKNQKNIVHTIYGNFTKY